jgi:hypothetical protein
MNTIYKHFDASLSLCVAICVALNFQDKNAWFSASGISPFTAASGSEFPNTFVSANLGFTSATAQQNFGSNAYVGGSIVPPDSFIGGGGGGFMNTENMGNDQGGFYPEGHMTIGLGSNAQLGPDKTIHVSQVVSDALTPVNN